eukprot:INCI18073.4.p1 GENE.INCI18073.4~~INCI18073.4.p1  ORF type:complete len:540 (-),score=100.35 INCI18073.4:8-1558(-)
MNAGGVHMEEPELKRSRGSKGDDSEDTDGESDNVGRGSSDSSDGGGAAVAAASAASPATAAASDNDSNNRKPLVQDLRDLIAMNNFISRSSVHSYNNKHAGNRVIKIINGQVLRDHKLVAEDFWVKGDKIIDPMSRFWDAQCTGDLEPEDIVIDAKNCIICPGFIDIQINGAFGVDFSNPAVTSADVDYVAANMVRYGVTGFLPTVVSSQPDVYKSVLPKLRPRAQPPLPQTGDNSLDSPRLPRTPPGSINLGLHLEGPFISKQQKGAHEVEALAHPTEGMASILERYGSLEGVRLVTLAPELDGAIDAIRGLKERGIIISIGHTECSIKQACKAIEAGSSLVTHLFNAMRSFHHRDPGIVGLLGSDEPTFFSVIADGIHAHDYALSLACGARPDKIIAVTDAMAAHGLPKGKHQLGKMAVDVKEDRAVLEGTDTLAGSIVSMDECVQHLKNMCCTDTVEVLEMATLHPAQVLGLAPQKGTLAFGADADFLFLDPETLEVQQTFIGGFNVYRKHKY